MRRLALLGLLAVATASQAYADVVATYGGSGRPVAGPEQQSVTTYTPVHAPVSQPVVQSSFLQPTVVRQPVVQQPVVQQPIVQPHVVQQPVECCDPCATPVPSLVQPAPAVVPTVPAPASTYRPVVTLSPSANKPVYVGHGLLGQPKAYVDGQPVRNFFRYILP